MYPDWRYDNPFPIRFLKPNNAGRPVEVGPSPSMVSLLKDGVPVAAGILAVVNIPAVGVSYVGL
jgi:hypothetical protein